MRRGPCAAMLRESSRHPVMARADFRTIGFILLTACKCRIFKLVRDYIGPLRGVSTRPHIICGESALIADVQTPAANDGMRPGGQAAVRNFKMPFLAIAIGRCFNQADTIVFTEDVQIAVRISDGSFPDTAVTPRDPASVKLKDRQDGIVEAIQISVNQHYPAVMVLHVLCEVGLRGFHLTALSCEVQQRAACAVR